MNESHDRWQITLGALRCLFLQFTNERFDSVLVPLTELIFDIVDDDLVERAFRRECREETLVEQLLHIFRIQMHVALVNEVDLDFSRVRAHRKLGRLVERVTAVVLSCLLWRILRLRCRRLTRLVLLMRFGDHDATSKSVTLHQLEENHHFLVADMFFKLLPVLVPVDLLVEEHAIIIFHLVQFVQPFLVVLLYDRYALTIPHFLTYGVVEVAFQRDRLLDLFLPFKWQTLRRAHANTHTADAALSLDHDVEAFGNFTFFQNVLTESVLLFDD